VTYRYHTEALFLEDKLLGRTGAHSTNAINALSARLNQLSSEGWELFQIAEVNVVGKIFKAEDRRGVTVAFFRRASNEHHDTGEEQPPGNEFPHPALPRIL
jgi:hypothetical protein